MGTGGSEGGVWAGRSAPDFVKWPCPKLRSAGSPRRRPSTAKRRRLIARNFAVHLTKFPKSPTENSLFFAQGILVLRRRSSGHFRCVSNGNSLQIEKIPCKFPYSREFARGDRFDAGCIHHHAVHGFRRFPAGGRKGPHLAGFCTTRRSLRPPTRGASGDLALLSLALEIRLPGNRRPPSAETRFEWP